MIKKKKKNSRKQRSGRKNRKKKKDTFGIPEGFEDGLVTQGVLATLHHEGKPVVNTLMGLLLQEEEESIT